MRGDHQLSRRAALRCKACKYLVEHTKPAQADEPIVDRPGDPYSVGASRHRKPYLITRMIR
jgi:hypothetical protein